VEKQARAKELEKVKEILVLSLGALLFRECSKISPLKEGGRGKIKKPRL